MQQATPRGDNYFMLPAGIKLQFVSTVEAEFLDCLAHYKQLIKYFATIFNF